MSIINYLVEHSVTDLGNHNSAQYLHLLAESLKFAFKDAEQYVADPSHPFPDILDPEFVKSRAELFDASAANQVYEHGVIIDPQARSDTSYFCVSDSEGNACSIIASLYNSFGTGIVPQGCGFALHNRGCNFSLDPKSGNVLGPSKRSYHTIIPAMLTRGNDLVGPFGVMGGFMQPQGHVQVALNMLHFGMNPQQALDAPRLCLSPQSEAKGGIPVDGVILNLEEGVEEAVAKELTRLGHVVKIIPKQQRSLFGRGQIIIHDSNPFAYHAGSDFRGDGAAIPSI